MKILHYSLGFPPYRTGGMTKFCMDLMQQQIKEGFTIALIWPGKMLISNRRTKIKFRGAVYGIASYEIINPTPVSYDEGINRINPFMDAGDFHAYERFIDETNPEVLHIHTLMGLHKSLLDCAKRKGIRLVFTAHDFFPICPKVTMFRENQICNHVNSCDYCAQCNNTALPIWKIKILQSPVYRVLKNTRIVKKFRKHHRDSYLGHMTRQNHVRKKLVSCPNDFLILRRYYNSLLKCMDVIHFNSSITKYEYSKYMDLHESVIIPITHSDIKDYKKMKHFTDHLNITYLGPQGSAKGFYLLRSSLDLLWKKRKKFSLHIFFEPKEIVPYMNIHPRYSYNQLEEIFETTDVLVAPSIWYETFGYTVLEALSFGVPVVITSNVGAKDIVPDGGGIIIDDVTANGLVSSFLELTPECLSEMNKIIFEKFYIPTMDIMSKKISEKCYIYKDDK